MYSLSISKLKLFEFGFEFMINIFFVNLLLNNLNINSKMNEIKKKLVELKSFDNELYKIQFIFLKINVYNLFVSKPILLKLNSFQKVIFVTLDEIQKNT